MSNPKFKKGDTITNGKAVYMILDIVYSGFGVCYKVKGNGNPFLLLCEQADSSFSLLDDKIDSIKRSVQVRLDEVKQYPDHFKCSCRDVRLILEEILNIIEG